MKKNRIISLLAALALAIVLLPTTALAVGQESIAITLKRDADTATVKPSDKLEVESVSWSSDTATVKVKVKDSQPFTVFTNNLSKLSVTVNGERAMFERVDDKHVTVTYTFQAEAGVTAETIISRVQITTGIPVEGRPLPTDASVPDSASCRVTGVEWTGYSNNGVAVAGVPNPVTVTLDIKDGVDAAFHTSVINVSINGKSMATGWWERVTATQLKVHYVFPALGGLDLPGVQSGVPLFDKMSQAEISAYLKNSANSTTLTSDPFTDQPSYSDPYSAGTLHGNALALTANRLTLMRRLAGLPAVMTHSDLISGTQAAAVLLASTGGFSNLPSKPSGMSSSFYSNAANATQKSTIYRVTSANYQLVHSIDVLMEGSDSGASTRLGELKGNDISTLYSRMWMLWPQTKYIGIGYALRGNTQYVTVDVTDYSQKYYYYDFVSWPASGNFPNNTDAFTSDSPWSVHLNPENYSKPAAKDLTVTITRASDGKVWTITSADSYQEGAEKFLSVNARKHYSCTGVYLEYSSIIFRPDGIDKYEGTYTVRIDGLKSKGGKDTSLSYTVIFFDADHPNDPIPAASSVPAAGTAYPSTQKVDIDGKKVTFQMYALKDANGNYTNYIKIRDLALALKGTNAKFDVTWDGTVNLVAGKAYKANGSENKTPFSGARAYSVPTDPTNVNGSASDLKAILIKDDAGNGYTYYKLRDVAKRLDFTADWNVDKGLFIMTEEQIVG